MGDDWDLKSDHRRSQVLIAVPCVGSARRSSQEAKRDLVALKAIKDASEVRASPQAIRKRDVDVTVLPRWMEILLRRKREGMAMGSLRPIPPFASDFHILDQLINCEMIIGVQFHFRPSRVFLSELRTIYQTRGASQASHLGWAKRAFFLPYKSSQRSAVKSATRWAESLMVLRYALYVEECQ